MIELNRDDTPPKKEGELWIERMKGATSKSIVILSPAIWGVWTHWNGKRSQPCWKDKSRCPGCIAKHPSRWKGYLHVLDYMRRNQIFLELTPTAARSLKDQVGTGVAMRGVRVTIRRTTSNLGRLLVAVEEAMAFMHNLPNAVDPLKTLLDIWKIEGDVDDWEIGVAVPA